MEQTEARTIAEPQPTQQPEPQREQSVRPVSGALHPSADIVEAQQGLIADAPLCLSCGVKMRPSGSCYVCENCGSTSGCS